MQHRPYIHYYDTKEGVQSYLHNLEWFNALIQDRFHDAYVLKQRLSEWCILGKWWLDSCGNLFKFCARQDGISGVPKYIDPNISDVLSNLEFDEWCKENKYIRHSSLVGSIPSHRMVCPRCKNNWTINNCDDFYAQIIENEFDLSEYTGRTLGKVLESISVRTDGEYFIPAAMRIRNNKYISADNNIRGWMGDRDNIDLQHVIEIGDSTNLMKKAFYHNQCWKSIQTEKEEQYFREVADKAG